MPKVSVGQILRSNNHVLKIRARTWAVPYSWILCRLSRECWQRTRVALPSKPSAIVRNEMGNDDKFLVLRCCFAWARAAALEGGQCRPEQNDAFENDALDLGFLSVRVFHQTLTGGFLGQLNPMRAHSSLERF